jgi:hypothetical protein
VQTISTPKQRRARPLTTRQKAILKRIYLNNGRDLISPDIARQLIYRGFVNKVDRYQPTSYGRPVKGATLWNVVLTLVGRTEVEMMGK